MKVGKKRYIHKHRIFHLCHAKLLSVHLAYLELNVQLPKPLNQLPNRRLILRHIFHMLLRPLRLSRLQQLLHRQLLALKLVERNVLRRLFRARNTRHGLEAARAHVAGALCEVGQVLGAVPGVEVGVGAGGWGECDGEEEGCWTYTFT